MPAGSGTNQISDPAVTSRNGSFNLRRVPGSSPALYATSRVPGIMSQHEYHSNLGYESMSRGFVPPKSFVSTSNLR